MLLSYYCHNYIKRCNSLPSPMRSLSIKNDDLPGGMNLDNFIYLTEKLSPFMKNIFDIKVTDVKKGHLQFIMPYRKHLIGNIQLYSYLKFLFNTSN